MSKATMMATLPSKKGGSVSIGVSLFVSLLFTVILFGLCIVSLLLATPNEINHVRGLLRPYWGAFRSTLSYLFTSDPAYISLFSISFAVNSWVAALKQIRQEAIARMTAVCEQKLKDITPRILNAADRRATSRIHQHIDHFDARLPLDIRQFEPFIEKQHRIFRWIMSVIAVVCICMLIIKKYPLGIAITTLLPFPMFWGTTLWHCWRLGRRIDKFMKYLKKAKQSATEVTAELSGHLDSMVEFADELESQMHSENRTTSKQSHPA